jgi:hypothetical protein
MPQNLFDHLALMALDEADDLQGSAAPRTEPRVHLVNLLDQGGPTLSRLSPAGALLLGGPDRGRLAFGPQAPGANDAQDLDPAASAEFRDGEGSGKPTLQARVAYGFPLWQNQKVEFGVWGHRAWQQTDSPIGASGLSDLDSEAAGLDLTVPLRDRAWLKGELWTGKNLSDVRGGILQGINATTGREIDAQGGWLELGARLLKWFSLHGGYSVDNPDDGDLAGAALAGRAKNSIWYGAVRGYFDPIEIGMDYLNWTTDHYGFGPGHDNRFQWYISYKF